MGKRALFLLVLVLVACGDDKPARAPLPGTIYFVEDTDAGPQLVRFSSGARVVIGRELFPSAHALPDGRLVAIASRGDGSGDSEQLALIGNDGRVERIGPSAAILRDPAVDMRGRWIVIAANLDGHSDLYRVELDGKTTRLTNDAQGNYSPAMVGESIVYASSRDGNSELYRDDQRLTTTPRDDWQPVPSPDGKTIAFLSDRDGSAHLYVMNADGTSSRRLSNHTGEESAPAWSRDCKQLAYVVDGHVWLRDTATGNERSITPAGARDQEPSFSPDGRWLAVARGDAVVAVNLGTGETSPIAAHGRLPRWRPSAN
jgi:TolB protein